MNTRLVLDICSMITHATTVSAVVSTLSHMIVQPANGLRGIALDDYIRQIHEHVFPTVRYLHLSTKSQTKGKQ
jgi:hypothetical protein